MESGVDSGSESVSLRFPGIAVILLVVGGDVLSLGPQGKTTR